MQSVRSVSIAGAGNVAVHLGKALVKAGIRIDFCWNRSHDKAVVLSNELHATATTDLTDFRKSDLILCCLSDDALTEFIPLLSAIGPVAATSGTVDVLTLDHSGPVGVLYPLQTFTKGRAISLENVPFFVESSVPEWEVSLLELARRISQKVYVLSWKKRQHLHLAAVFVNNFTNHLASIAQKHLESEALPFDWLLPLLDETIAKLKEQPAAVAQTGPARRNDVTTIKRHLDLLSGKDAEVYRILTASITEFYHHD